MKNSFKLAFGGVATALALVFMLITPILPIALYSCAVLSGLCVALACEEIGIRLGCCVYAAVSFLSLLLIPDKEPVIIFMLLFGIYPVLNAILDKSRNKLLTKRFIRTVIKLIFINAACVVYFFMTVYILGVPKESFNIGDVYLPWVFLLFGNIICIMYDIALIRFIVLYKLKRIKLFKGKW